MAGPGIGAALVVAALLALGGCGASADDTTCDEYGRMEREDRVSEIRALLSEHDLDEDDPGNLDSVWSTAAHYCGGDPDGELGDAADWSASSWREKGF
jgi:hypothetical protein